VQRLPREPQLVHHLNQRQEVRGVLRIHPSCLAWDSLGCPRLLSAPRASTIAHEQAPPPRGSAWRHQLDRAPASTKLFYPNAGAVSLCLGRAHCRQVRRQVPVRIELAYVHVRLDQRPNRAESLRPPLQLTSPRDRTNRVGTGLRWAEQGRATTSRRLRTCRSGVRFTPGALSGAGICGCPKCARRGRAIPAAVATIIGSGSTCSTPCSSVLRGGDWAGAYFDWGSTLRGVTCGRGRR
jgi:hypothetical protein